MNEQLQKKVNDTLERIKDFSNSIKELKDKINDLRENNLVDTEEYSKLNNLYMYILKFTRDNLVKDVRLIDEYIKVVNLSDNEILVSNSDNDARINAINELVITLSNINELEDYMVYSKEDINKLVEFAGNINSSRRELYRLLSSICLDSENNIDNLADKINNALDELEKIEVNKLSRKFSDDSERIAYLLSAFKFGPAKKEKILSKYKDLNTTENSDKNLENNDVFKEENKTTEISKLDNNTFEEEENVESNNRNAKTAKIILGIIGVAAAIAVLTAAVKSASAKNYAKANMNDTKGNTVGDTDLSNNETTEVVEIVDRATDLSNRAKAISETNFFSELYQDEIIDVLEAIDNKTILNDENANNAQTIKMKFNSLYEHYLNNTITEQDIKSVDALKYFAKTNSDLDNFLETYTTLFKDVLTNINDQNAKDKMMSYLEVFAEHLNGFDNPYDKDNILTSDKELNDQAIVENFYDYAMIHELIVGPSIYMFYPKELEQYDTYAIDIIMHTTEENRNSYINTLPIPNDYKTYLINTTKELLSNHPEAVKKALRLSELNMEMYSVLANQSLYDCHVTNDNVLNLGGK